MIVTARARQREPEQAASDHVDAIIDDQLRRFDIPLEPAAHREEAVTHPAQRVADRTGR